MADNMECEICGGTDFYKEAGFFYCKECQTQSQEVREHIFEEDIAHVNVKSTKKIKQAKKDKPDSKLTSWECYNIVMCSLTQQLISLGADRSLKAVVKCLWLRYLEKLEVFNLDENTRPKLPLVNVKKDVKILYNIGKRKKRKRKKSVSDESIATTLDSVSLKRERSKKKRALAQAQYDEFSHKSTHESSSLHNETLTSLKSSSEKSTKADSRIIYNRYSYKELRKRLSTDHCRKHKLDSKLELKCHKLTYDSVSTEYRQGIHFVSPIKLYCILYLGLLITKDKICLSDLLRFLKEGHLSSNNYTRLFPEEYSNKLLNINNNNKNRPFSNKTFRTTTAKLAKFLDVGIFIVVPNLEDLSQRFCTEMNLPDEIFFAVKNVLSKTVPRLRFTRKHTIIPNYEGRIVSIILFVLKLLYGFDGVTEFQLSNFGKLVNNLNLSQPKMFEVVKWLEYLSYRSLLISQYYFPYTYLNSSFEVNSDLFLQYVKSQNFEPDENKKLVKEMSDYKELLIRIREIQNQVSFERDYPPSLTPFLKYSEVLSNSLKYNCLENVLQKSFQKESIEYLLLPGKYIRLFGEQTEFKHGGANDNWVIEDLKTSTKIRKKSRQNHKLIPVEVLREGNEKHINESLAEEPKPVNKKYDPRYVQKNYEKYRQHVFKQNDSYIKRLCYKNYLDVENAGTGSQGLYKTHFIPYERYWLYLQMNMDKITKSDCERFFDKHANTFKLVFNECSRIVEQTTQELFTEFEFTELYLVYSANYCSKTEKPKPKKLLGSNLAFYVQQAETHW